MMKSIICLINQLDKKGDGSVEFEEFLHYLVLDRYTKTKTY